MVGPAAWGSPSVGAVQCLHLLLPFHLSSSLVQAACTPHRPFTPKGRQAVTPQEGLGEKTLGPHYLCATPRPPPPPFCEAAFPSTNLQGLEELF